jgi:hypothetical protein
MATYMFLKDLSYVDQSSTVDNADTADAQINCLYQLSDALLSGNSRRISRMLSQRGACLSSFFVLFVYVWCIGKHVGVIGSLAMFPAK